jgi:2-polyprenyl-3-methyl-5-hydroxy-6-metoxy-1,4-benzoquinol methylase
MQMINYGWNSASPKKSNGYILPKILEMIPKNEKIRILDAGCGNGYLAGVLAELGHIVVGIDQDEEGIKIARDSYPLTQFYTYSVYDIPSVFFGNFDCIISTEVIEHLYSPSLFLEKMYNLIQPGGSIILSTPYHGYVKNLALSIFNKWDKHFTVGWDGGHIKFFSMQTLEKLLITSGFSNCKFNNAGRVKYLWKSMVCKAQKL